MNIGQVNFGTSSVGPEKPFSFDEFLVARKGLDALPKGKWALMAPNGRVWAEEDPMRLAQRLAMMAMSEGGFGHLKFEEKATS
jgi:hypothetical protein